MAGGVGGVSGSGDVLGEVARDVDAELRAELDADAEVDDPPAATMYVSKRTLESTRLLPTAVRVGSGRRSAGVPNGARGMGGGGTTALALARAASASQRSTSRRTPSRYIGSWVSVATTSIAGRGA